MLGKGTLKEKLSQCAFNKVEVAFIDHVVGKHGLRPDLTWGQRSEGLAKGQNPARTDAVPGVSNVQGTSSGALARPALCKMV
jgi:hypothetical protein